MSGKKHDPLSALHAARMAAESREKPAPPDGLDPIQLAVIQGLAANPATAMLSPDDFAARADAIIAAMGVPASMLETESNTRAEHRQHEDHMQHVLTLLNVIERSEHALRDDHNPLTCTICAAREWLETL